MKKVTIQDIAAELGLSRNTVAKALNGGVVSPPTKQAVIQKAWQMGYAKLDERLLDEVKTSYRRPNTGIILVLSNHNQSVFWNKVLAGISTAVSDEGYRGVILQLAEAFQDIRVRGERIYAQAGARLSKVANAALEHGLSGMEFAAGIPGTVGGGVVMNAGAYDGEMKQVVDSVTVLDRDGSRLELDNDTMEFGYRTSAIKSQPFIVTECCFRLRKGEKEAIAARTEELQRKRKEKQPLEYPSAGSTFKRPEGYFAGKLIMDAGLAGESIGGAQVSEKHCGFIINTGNATAADIRRLIARVQEEVDRCFHVRLEPEVIFLGKF